MGSVILFNAARMQAIEDGTVVSGLVDVDGHLILTHHDGSTVDAGKVQPENLEDASESVKGIIQIASDAEAIAGTDSLKAIVPSSLLATLNDRTATDSQTGLVELATLTETNAGTDDTRAVTPASLSDVLERVATVDHGYLYAGSVYFTSSGTFSKADYPWLRAIRVRCQGGGGAGGGSQAAGSGQSSKGGGGGGGGYAESFITDISGLDADVTVTVGAGGVGVSGGAGGTGGESSFGSYTHAGAGSGAPVGSPSATAFGASGAAGGAGIAGDLLLTGGGGAMGFGSAGLSAGGSGGNSVLGGGGQGTARANVGVIQGVDGGNYGGGGSGSLTAAGSAAATGGDGAPGIVIVELFA